MNRALQSVYVLNSFATGIILPVLSLVLLAKGANLQTLPLLLAVFSLIVLTMELPTGVFADIYGRKAAFLISCVFTFSAFILLFVANNIVWLIFSIILFGLGRAFSSGSLDALIIDQTLNGEGEGCLAKVSARLALLESVGLALGGIGGGLMVYFLGGYTGIIILRLGLTLVVFVLSLALIKEQRRPRDTADTGRIALTSLFRQSKAVIRAKPKLAWIFGGVFLSGFFLFAIETYWQPAFMNISSGQNNTWLLGVVTFGGYGAIILGSMMAQKLLEALRQRWWQIYNICRLAMAAVLTVFVFQNAMVGFIIWFAGIYLLFGIANVAEYAQINKYTPEAIRSSMLSLTSLVSQAGGICASIFSSIFILKLQFSGIWLLAAALLGGYALIMVFIPKIGREE